jgi:fructokinase
MADVVAFGELLVDFVPAAGAASLMAAETFKKAAGGAPANVAAGLARLGVSSAFMGMTGEDGFGRFLAGELEKAGVDVASLRFSAKARTGLAFVSLEPNGERDFLFYRSPGADMLMTPGDIDEGALRAAKAFHFGSISLGSEPSRTSTLHAAALARHHGKLITYDPNLRRELWPTADDARAGMRLGLAEAEVVKIAEEELRFLADEPDPVVGGRRLWHPRLRLMAITRGRAGCTWMTAEAHGEVRGFPVTSVDATGAGDAFMAGLIAGLLAAPAFPTEAATIAAACRFANAAGALATTGRGAIPSMPTRQAVEELMRNFGLGPAV